MHMYFFFQRIYIDELVEYFRGSTENLDLFASVGIQKVQWNFRRTAKTQFVKYIVPWKIKEFTDTFNWSLIIWLERNWSLSGRCPYVAWELSAACGSKP